MKNNPYNPKYGDHIMCECGHAYLDHFNPETNKNWGCFWSYNCDCEEFKQKMGVIYVSDCCGKEVEDRYIQYPVELTLEYFCRGCGHRCTPVGEEKE